MDFGSLGAVASGHGAHRAILILFLFGLAINASAAEPKRVLIINSFGSAAPPFSIHETSFEGELVKNLGERSRSG